MPFTWNLLGELYLGQHDMAAANDALTQGQQVCPPTWWVPYRNLALARLATNDMAGAGLSVRRPPSRFAPMEIGASRPRRAQIFEKQGHPEEAIASYGGLIPGQPHIRG